MRALVLIAALLFPASMLSQDAQAVFEKAKQEAALEITFRQPEPKFQKLVVHKEETGELNGIKTASYSFSVSGVAKDKTYILMVWNVGYEAPTVLKENVVIRDDGKLGCGEAKDCPPNVGKGGVFWVRVPSTLGLPKRFVLAEKNHAPHALGEDIPFPSVGSDKGCTIEAVLLRSNAAVTLIVGQGFDPDEEVTSLSSSWGEEMKSSTKADANGRVLSIVLPFVKGFDGGETNYKIQGSKCQPSTKFYWGKYKEETDGKK